MAPPTPGSSRAADSGGRHLLDAARRDAVARRAVARRADADAVAGGGWRRDAAAGGAAATDC